MSGSCLVRWTLAVLLLGPYASSAASTSPPVWVIGLDGATWEVLDPLIAQGELPELARWCAEGTSGTLVSDRAYSAPSWTSIQTGVIDQRHGITDFTFPAEPLALAWPASEHPRLHHHAGTRLVETSAERLAQTGRPTLTIGIPANVGARPSEGGRVDGDGALLLVLGAGEAERFPGLSPNPADWGELNAVAMVLRTPTDPVPFWRNMPDGNRVIVLPGDTLTRQHGQRSAAWLRVTLASDGTVRWSGAQKTKARISLLGIDLQVGVVHAQALQPVLEWRHREARYRLDPREGLAALDRWRRWLLRQHLALHGSLGVVADKQGLWLDPHSPLLRYTWGLTASEQAALPALREILGGTNPLRPGSTWLAERPDPWKLEVLQALAQSRPWSTVMIVLSGIDLVMHGEWTGPANDPAAPEPDPDSAIRDAWRVVDRWLGRIRRLAPASARLLIVSDHGFQALPDRSRRRWNFNPLLNPPVPAGSDNSSDARRFADPEPNGPKPDSFRWHPDTIDSDSGSFVCRGCDAAAVEALRSELHGWRDVPHGRPLFAMIGGARANHDARAIEIRVNPQLSDAPIGVILTHSSHPDRRLPLQSLSGHPWIGGHHPHGVLIAAGPGIAASRKRIQAREVDVAATVLAWHGLRVAGLDGKPLAELTGARNSSTPTPALPPSQADLEALRDQLRSLGYVR